MERKYRLPMEALRGPLPLVGATTRRPPRMPPTNQAFATSPGRIRHRLGELRLFPTLCKVAGASPPATPMRAWG
jgi:hypothetical protein